jgi:hypothetical protein
MAQYQIECQDGRIAVDGVPLVFCHFHGFKFIKSNIVQPANYVYKISSSQIENFFMPYAHVLRAHERILHGLKSGTPIRGEGDQSNRGGNSWLNVKLGLLEQRWFLLSPKWLALKLWRYGEAQHNHFLKASYALRCDDRLAALLHILLTALLNPLMLRDPKQVRRLWKRK